MKKSSFVDRLLILAELINPNTRNKEKKLSEITGEKESTIKNWLFNNKKPPRTKRLSVSDKLGVSEACLFDDSENIEHPVAIYDDNAKCYLVPKINELDILKINNIDSPLLVSDRMPVKLKDDIEKSVKDISQTYCAELKNIDFPPFILEGSYVFFNATAQKKDGIFCFYYDKSQSVEIAKLMMLDSRISLVTKNASIIKKPITNRILPIILTISTEY